MLSPPVIAESRWRVRLWQLWETTCEGRGLCLTQHVAKRARRLKSVDTAPFPTPKLRLSASMNSLCLHGKEGGGSCYSGAIPYAS